MTSLNTWYKLDFDRVIQVGGEAYTLEDYRKWFRTVTDNEYSSSSSTSPTDVLSLWKRNRKYIINYSDPPRRKQYHLILWKRSLYKGEAQDPKSKSLPLLDLEQMEMDGMCIFLIDVLETFDPTGKYWLLPS
jgi:hypothetical protein